jgi:hypothetical protein
MKRLSLVHLLLSVALLAGGLSEASSRIPTGRIRGRCILVPGPGNPIGGPCVNTVLSLSDTNGNEVSRERTSASGDFEFKAEPGMKFRLGSGSRFYDVVSPTDLVKTGQTVELKLLPK